MTEVGQRDLAIWIIQEELPFIRCTSAEWSDAWSSCELPSSTLFPSSFANAKGFQLSPNIQLITRATHRSVSLPTFLSPPNTPISSLMFPRLQYLA